MTSLAGAPLAQAPVPEAGLTADEWAARARELAKRGPIFEALEDYDHAVAVDRSRLDIRLEYAGLLKSSGFWLRSADQYNTILALQPDHVDGLIGYGELLNAEYQFAAAKERFLRALGVSPDARGRERALVGLGGAQFGLEDFSGAAGTFTTILEGRPDAMTALAFLAISRRRLGELDESERLWGKFLEIQPDASRAKFHRREIQELKQDLDQARQAAHTVSGAAAWARLGDLLRAKPDLTGAAEAYTEAARLAPRDASLQFRKGAVLRDLRRWNEAASSLSAVGDDTVYGTLALYNLAYCARRAGDHESEMKAWQRAVDLNREDLYAYRRYVGSLKTTRGLDPEKARAAEAVAKRASSQGPPDALPWVRLALVEDMRGDRAAARRAALDAVREDINDVGAQRVLRELLASDERVGEAALRQIDEGGAGQSPADRARVKGAILQAMGRGREAEAEFLRSMDLEKEDARSLVAVASSLRSRGAQDKAIALLSAARNLRPDYRYVHLDLALTLLDAGRVEDAISAGREAIRLAPDNPLGYSIVGATLKDKGDLEKAIQALERAVAIDPMDEIGAPRLLLAKLYGAAGRNEEARAVLTGDLPEDPGEIYRMVWQFVRDNYQDRTFHAQDWGSWRDRFEGRLSSTADALGAAALMLSSLDDRNTRLRSADQTLSLLFSPRSDAAEFSQSGVALSTSRTVETRRLEGNIGYIAVTNLSDPKFPVEMEKAVEEMKSTNGVILDLRGNQGGADADVSKITGMFVKPGTETGTIVSPQGTEKTTAEPPRPQMTKPLLAEDKPVAVLVDHNTASSAENLAGSLREAKGAILVGETTYGKSSIQMPKLLPGGAIVLVVAAEHGDLGGAIYTGKGLRPDVPVQAGSPSARPEDDPAVKKAREALKKPRPGS